MTRKATEGPDIGKALDIYADVIQPCTKEDWIFEGPGAEHLDRAVNKNRRQYPVEFAKIESTLLAITRAELAACMKLPEQFVFGVEMKKDNLAGYEYVPNWTIRKAPGALDTTPFWSVVDKHGDELFQIVRVGDGPFQDKERLVIAGLRSSDKLAQFFRIATEEKPPDAFLEIAQKHLSAELSLGCTKCFGMGAIFRNEQEIRTKLPSGVARDLIEAKPINTSMPSDQDLPLWVHVHRCDKCNMFSDPIQACQFHFENWQVSNGPSYWGNVDTRREESRELALFARELFELSPEGATAIKRAATPQEGNHAYSSPWLGNEKDAVILQKDPGLTSEGQEAIQKFMDNAARDGFNMWTVETSSGPAKVKNSTSSVVLKPKPVSKQAKFVDSSALAEFIFGKTPEGAYGAKKKG